MPRPRGLVGRTAITSRRPTVNRFWSSTANMHSTNGTPPITRVYRPDAEAMDDLAAILCRLLLEPPEAEAATTAAQRKSSTTCFVEPPE